MSLVSKLAQLFAPNAHAIRYFDEKRAKWNYRKIGRPLEEADLTRHVSKRDPEFSLGAYVLRDLENSRGQALIFDFDDHDSDSGPLITEIAVKFSRILEEMGLPYLLFQSGGGNGFHFYLLFEESQPKSWLRALGKHLVCEKLRLTEGTNGVKAGEVEIFPKSDRPGGENVIALPLARKSVALRREGDHFVEAPEPTEIPYCPLLTQIEDPGYGKSAPAGNGRREFLQQLIGYTDRTAHAVLSLGDGEEKPKWQRLDEPLAPVLLSNPDNIIGAYFPIDPKGDKAQVMVIGVREAESISSALSEYAHFVVSSANGYGFYVWIVFNKPRRKDQLRKIAKDAIAAAGLQDFAILAPGNGPVELPFSGESRFVSGFNDNGAIFGPIPSRMPVDQGRTPGPKQKTPNKDEAFACIVSAINAADYDSWVKVGHLLIAAFGKDDPWAFERWSSWAVTAPNGDTPDALQHKWEKDLADKPAYSPASFWLAAKDAGYVGALPFGKSEEKKFQSLDLIVGVPLFRSKEEASFATIGPRRHVEVRSRAFQQFVRLQTLNMGGDLMSAETLSAVVETVDAKCQEDTERFPVHLRVARHDDKGYLFLGDDARTVIQYGADGFRECAEPPVRFRLAPGSKPLPIPVAGTLKDLRALFNLDDENWALLLSWVVMTLVHPGRPMPICVLNGEHGSAKTTALKQVVAILDPKVGATAGPPKTEDDLIASAYSSHVVSFDNVSSFSALSDPLCRLATGGGLRKRQLFTDNNLAAYDVIRPVIVSGIDPTAFNLDIIERLFTVELSRPDVYLTEEEVTARFEAVLPNVLGALLILAGLTISKLPEVNLAKPPRMADFAKVGEVVAQSQGFAPGWFIDTYQEMLESAAADNAEGDPVFSFVEAEMTRRFSGIMGLKLGAELKIKASELQTRMMQDQRNDVLIINRQDVPRNARVFSSRLFRVRKQLQESGFFAEKLRSDRSWRFEVASADLGQKLINRQGQAAKAKAADDEVPF